MARPKRTAKANSAAATAAEKRRPFSPDEYMKIMLAAGSVYGNELSDSEGGIVICGTGPQPPSRKQRCDEFERQLKLMARRAKDADCFIVFDVKRTRRKSGSPDRFLQFRFDSKSFCMVLPKTTFVAEEAQSLVSNRSGFYFRSTRRVAKDEKSYVKQLPRQQNLWVVSSGSGRPPS